MLAVIQTVALMFAVDNLHLAFAGSTFIRFTSGHAQMRYFTVLSYLQAAMWIVEAIASLLLVRWIVQRFGRKSNAA